jgi:hemerythrin-like domain-containing protein
MEVNYLKKQHNEFESILQELEQKLESEDKIVENAFSLTMLIANIAGKLRIHLGSEDKYLYPKLLESPDQKVKTTAQEFIKEMGDLADTFESYKSKYMNVKNIRTNPQDFISETKSIIQAITKRVEKEEQELYTLL